ncbi:unnamed protein product [Chrysodeixis includens]|uniref:Mitochondrial glutamate carrier 2 n=1 Tax=Chrysodeixis includens TaxID=689277 RepID=A0A9P0BU70_CHRIL|nr:unnamed protein product [Chrysodeixis includens]
MDDGGPIEPGDPHHVPEATRPTQFDLVPKIINGGIAGVVGCICIFPIDLVKTRLQNQTIGPNGEKQYKNMIDCFRQTIRREGYFGMYRGVAVNVLLVSPEKALKLAANDVCRWLLLDKDGHLPLYRQAISGGVAGFFQMLVSTPMELLKIQLQDAGRVAAQAKDSGRIIPRLTAKQVTMRLMKERGILGLYRGMSATAARDIGFACLYFPLYAELRDCYALAEKDTVPPFWWSFASGCISGCISGLLATPLDVIKTRMQTIKKGKHERYCGSILGCAKQIWVHEGPTAFFKGGLCRISVFTPLYGILQAVYYLCIAERLLGYPLLRAI